MPVFGDIAFNKSDWLPLLSWDIRLDLTEGMCCSAASFTVVLTGTGAFRAGLLADAPIES